ncbi:hypothetical protein JB92DRAFT_2942212 [Gautieria morchelliformis]|nr:hypothetical protein JB92DRAFT_2942212 [Gautieria morchelliformis]
MVGLQLITAAATIVLYVFYISPGVGLPSIHNLTGCSSPSAPKNLAVSLVPSLVNAVVLCLLMLYKQCGRYGDEFGPSQLKLLVQDSILAVHLTNLLVFYLAPRGLLLVAAGWGFAIPCTMGCRLLLNMFNHYGRFCQWTTHNLTSKLTVGSKPIGNP